MHPGLLGAFLHATRQAQRYGQTTNHENLAFQAQRYGPTKNHENLVFQGPRQLISNKPITTYTTLGTWSPSPLGSPNGL